MDGFGNLVGDYLSLKQALIAQLVEQKALNFKVPGSSPGGGTIKIQNSKVKKQNYMVAMV